MLIIPAVDMKDGKAVRLQQGRAERQTVYDADPVHAALAWVNGGARRIHIVDLDGAFEGKPRNRDLTLAILKAITVRGVEVQVGGGLRDAECIAAFLSAGAARCVVGTRALEDRAFLSEL